MTTNNTVKLNYRWIQGGFAILVVLSAQIFAAQLGHRTPKDSFLVHQVSSVKELVAELKLHPYIRDRYAKLYNISPNSVEGYMEKNLVLSTLRHNYTHSVYCITPNGVVFTALETQPKGTKVFALRRTGNPVLRWACGNPFTPELPRPPGLVVFTGITHRHAKPTYVAKRLRVPPPGKGNSLQTTEIASNLNVPSPGEVNVIQPNIPIVTKIPIYPFIPIIPIIFSSTGGTTGPPPPHHHTTTTTSTTTTTTTTTGPHTTTSGTTTGPLATPEPGSFSIWTIAGLMLALGAAVGQQKKRSRSARP